MNPAIKQKRIVESSFISFLLLSIFLFIVFQMIRGFYLNILLGVVLAIFLRPVHLKLTSLLKGRGKLGAIATILLTVILILIPLIFLVQLLANEAISIGRNTKFDGLEQSLDKVIEQVNYIAKERTGASEFLKRQDVINLIRSKSTLFGQSLLGILGNFFSVIASLIIVFMTIYYTLVDWEKIRDYIYRSSPLSVTSTRKMAIRALAVVRATIRGNMVMICVQAFAGGLGLYMFGIKSPILLGALYGLASLVPTIGTGTVWIPSVAYLVLTGHYFAAIGLALWNMAIVGSLDNFIMPALVRRGASLHPFLILVGVLGGISLFGLVGFIIGPTIIALTLVSIELYKENSLDLKVK
jgi:predicted PurR-regulated permease PerM